MKRLVVVAFALLLTGCAGLLNGFGQAPVPPIPYVSPTPFIPSGGDLEYYRPAAPIAITLHNSLLKEPVPYFERTNCGNHPWPLAPFTAPIPAQNSKNVVQDFAATCFVAQGQFAVLSVRGSVLMDSTWCGVRAENVSGRIAFTIDYAGWDTVCTLTSDGLAATLNYALKPGEEARLKAKHAFDANPK